MKIKKNILSLLFCAVITALILCACTTDGSSEEQETVPTALHHEETTAPVRRSGDCIETAREQNFTYTDSVDNYYDVTYRIPEITLFSTDAMQINSEIAAEFEPIFTEAENCMRDKSSLSCDSLDYEYIRRESVLSVMITRVYYSHVIAYNVYNIDVHTERRLTNEGLVEALGGSMESVTGKLKKALEKDYKAKFKSTENYERNSERTLSDENLGSASLFLDSDGRLCAVCTEYADVGAKSFDVIIIIG